MSLDRNYALVVEATEKVVPTYVGRLVREVVDLIHDYGVECGWLDTSIDVLSRVVTATEGRGHGSHAIAEGMEGQ